MNKKVIIGIVIVVVVLIGQTMVVSQMAEDQMVLANEQLDKHPLFSVVDSNYSKGLFGGEATTRVKLNDANNPAEFTLHHKVSTVPVFNLNNGNTTTGLAHIRTKLVLDDEDAMKSMKAFFSGAEPSMDTVVDFSQNMKIYFNIPQANFSEEKEITDNMGNISKKLISVTFSGLNSDIDVSADGKQISGLMDIPLFLLKEHSAQSGNFELKLEKISSDFSLNKVTNSLYSGDGNLKVATIDITNPVVPVTMSNNLITYKVTDNKDTFDYQINSSVEKISSSTGSPLPINYFKSEFNLRNLDILAFENYMQTFEEQARQGGQQNFEAMLPQLLIVGEQFLKRDINLGQNFKVGTQSGDGNIDVNVDFKAIEDTMTLQTMNIEKDLIPRASADIKLNLPKPLLAMTPLAQQIPQFIQAGYVKEEGDRYTSHAQFKDSKLTINGNEVAIPLGASVGAVPTQPPVGPNAQ